MRDEAHHGDCRRPVQPDRGGANTLHVEQHQRRDDEQRNLQPEVERLRPGHEHVFAGVLAEQVHEAEEPEDNQQRRDDAAELIEQLGVEFRVE